MKKIYFSYFIFLTFLVFSTMTAAGTMVLAPPIAIKAAVYEVTPGKTFEQILTSIGFSRVEANKLLMRRIIPTKMHLVPNERFLVLTDPMSHRIEGRFYLDYSDEALVFSKLGDKINVDREPVDFKVLLKKIAGNISGGIIESIKRLIPDDWAAFRFMDAFSWDLNFKKNLQKNDSYKFSIEEKFDKGYFVKYGEITNAELTTHGEIFKRILWANNSARVFVDPSARFDDRPFFAPVDYLHISSPFTKRRFHPVRHNYQPHLGVDFALSEGSPVYAARDAIVESVDHHRANGNFILLKHDHAFFTTYNHLGKYAVGLHEGQTVKAGDIIGYVGCTGYCTSPHLDFRIRQGDYVYDPMYLTKPFPFKERNYHGSIKFKNLLVAMEP